MSDNPEPAGGEDPPAEAAEPAQPAPEPEAPVGDQAVADPAAAPADEASAEPMSVEDLIVNLEKVTEERDQYMRVAAEYSNFRKQSDKRQGDMARQAAASTVERLLPVLDACDGAMLQGAADVAPIHKLLLETLTALGLAPIGTAGEPFDPNRHEAVMTEPAAEGDEGQVVAEVLRAGYAFNERTLRAAMVKVRG